MTQPLTRRSFVAHSLVLTASASLGASAAASSQPNIVFILADDLGYADLSCYGRREYKTENIDRLAQQSVRLTQAYSNSSVCSPTRFALMTGRYQYRLRGGLEEPIRKPEAAIGLPRSHPTLPSLLKKAGYSTALIGKWHLGFLPEYGPLKSGYDEFFGNHGGAIDYFSHRGTGDAQSAPRDLFEGEMPIEKTGYYTNLIADRAVEFISRPRSNPFLISIHFTAPHWPWEGPEDEAVSKRLKEIQHFDGGNLATYASMVLALDAAVGRVLRALEDRGLEKNTIVVFTSDNGGERFSDNWPFSGQKSELLEGGIRVPAIIRWPAQLAPSISTQVMMTMDWMPTLLTAAGVEPDQNHPSDGMNVLPSLSGAREEFERTLYWRYKRHGQRAMRSGDFKYLRINGSDYLFDLSKDVRERANLAQMDAPRLAQMRSSWEGWNKTMLPITDEVFSSGPTSSHQADRYFNAPVSPPN